MWIVRTKFLLSSKALPVFFPKTDWKIGGLSSYELCFRQAIVHLGQLSEK